MSSSNFYNPQNDGVGFSKRWDYLHKTTRIFFEGFHTLFSIQYFLSALLFVSRFRLWLFFGCSDSILVWFLLFCDFVWWLLFRVYFCIQERSWRACHTSAGNSAGIGRIPRPFFYNPQNDGVWFFKTMGFISQNDAYIFWGVITPLFFSLWGLSSLWFLSPLWFLSRRFFVLSSRFCSFRFCFSLALVAFSLFLHFFVVELCYFLVLFGGFDFVRTFADE